MGQVLLTVLSGHVVGLSLGATGAGGALVAVPLLVYVLGRDVPQAVAISLILVGCTAALGALKHAWTGEVHLRVALIFGTTGAPGAWVGAHAHALVSDRLALLSFGILMLAVSVHMLWSHTSEAGSPLDRTEAERIRELEPVKVSGVGLVVGWLTGFFGVGGGFIVVPGLVYVLGFPIRTAIGTSLFITALMSVGGIAGHLQRGGIDGALVGLMAAGAATGLVVGMRLGRLASPTRLTQGFAAFSLVLSLSVIVDNGASMAAALVRGEREKTEGTVALPVSRP